MIIQKNPDANPMLIASPPRNRWMRRKSVKNSTMMIMMMKLPFVLVLVLVSVSAENRNTEIVGVAGPARVVDDSGS